MVCHIFWRMKQSPICVIIAMVNTLSLLFCSGITNIRKTIPFVALYQLNDVIMKSMKEKCWFKLQYSSLATEKKKCFISKLHHQFETYSVFSFNYLFVFSLFIDSTQESFYKWFVKFLRKDLNSSNCRKIT